MSTPSNFYKNTAYSYAREFDLDSVLENLHAYRVAAGEVDPLSGFPSDDRKGAESLGKRTFDGNSKVVQRGKPPSKRPRDDSRVPGKTDEKEELPPSSDPHADYIRRTSRLKDAESRSSVPFLSTDSEAQVALQMGFKTYQNDTGNPISVFANHDEGLAENRALTQNSDASPFLEAIKCSSSDQRFAAPGEPTCCRCGRYGEYICDETGDDVCSLNCKTELLQERAGQRRQAAASASTYFVAPTPPADALQIPEMEPDRWDFKKNRWTNRESSLSTFRCWKCKRSGHLPGDCTATLGMVAQSPADPTRFTISTKTGGAALSSELRALYQRCKKLGASTQQGCKRCGQCSNLAACLYCGDYFCDSSGHLTGHLLSNPQHRQIYSFKLKRLVKCSKGTCSVTDVMELLVCQFCFNKAFDRFYSMYTARWKGDGLKLICIAICCEDHFDWHRMNCPHADVEGSARLIRQDVLKQAQLSEFLF